MDELRTSRSLADLAGRHLDDHSPALVVLSARELNQADVDDLVRRDELAWRLIEWRDTRGQSHPAAAHCLLRAS